MWTLSFLDRWLPEVNSTVLLFICGRLGSNKSPLGQLKIHPTHTHSNSLHCKHTHTTYRPQQMPPLSHRQETPSTSSIRLPVSMYLTLLTMKSHSSKPAFRIFYIYIGRKLQKQFVDHVTCASFVVEYCGNRLRFLPKTSSFATKSQTKSSTESHQFPDM